MPSSNISWPLAFNVIRQNSVRNTFGYVRRYADGSPKAHQGWDFAAHVGTPLYAVSRGEVVFVQNNGAYGIQLCLSFRLGGQLRYAFYAHLQNVWCAAGDRVEPRQVIGTTGISGNAGNLPPAEHHLHFESRIIPYCGLGLEGRLSPIAIFGICPLHSPILG